MLHLSSDRTPGRVRRHPASGRLFGWGGRAIRVLVAAQALVQRLPRQAQEPRGHALIAVGAAQCLGTFHRI